MSRICYRAKGSEASGGRVGDEDVWGSRGKRGQGGEGKVWPYKAGGDGRRKKGEIKNLD